MAKALKKARKPKAESWPLERIEEVEWIDSCMSSSWNSRAGYGQHQTGLAATSCRSVGYLLSESKQHVQLLLSQDRDCDNVNGAIAIPKVAIRKRRRIR